jgi:hypothetical protein
MVGGQAGHVGAGPAAGDSLNFLDLIWLIPLFPLAARC